MTKRDPTSVRLDSHLIGFALRPDRYMMTSSYISRVAAGMRTIIDLPEEQIRALKQLSEAARVSRAELMRRAVAEYLVRHQPTATDEAFGLWRHRDQDGLAYQDRMRGEWAE